VLFSLRKIEQKITEKDKKRNLFIVLLWLLPLGTLWVLLFLIILNKNKKQSQRTFFKLPHESYNKKS
jgi:cytochrome c-type biogenesis protein CcmH/NrfF